MKKIIKFLVILLPWFLSSIIFKVDSNFYETIKKPFFAPPGFIFIIIWPILYILIAISIYNNKNKSYSVSLRKYATGYPLILLFISMTAIFFFKR